MRYEMTFEHIGDVIEPELEQTGIPSDEYAPVIHWMKTRTDVFASLVVALENDDDLVGELLDNAVAGAPE